MLLLVTIGYYWLQMFLNKLMEVVVMEQSPLHIKELALECFLQVIVICISCDVM